MSTLSEKIDALLNEADDCELLSNLATTPESRQAYRERAAELCKLARGGKKLEQASSHASTAEEDLSHRRGA